MCDLLQATPPMLQLLKEVDNKNRNCRKQEMPFCQPCFLQCLHLTSKPDGGDAVTSLQFKFEQHLQTPAITNERCQGRCPYTLKYVGDNGKENGNYYIIVGIYDLYIYIYICNRAWI